jgi:hypothetical protein
MSPMSLSKDNKKGGLSAHRLKTASIFITYILFFSKEQVIKAFINIL